MVLETTIGTIRSGLRHAAGRPRIEPMERFEPAGHDPRTGDLYTFDGMLGILDPGDASPADHGSDSILAVEEWSELVGRNEMHHVRHRLFTPFSPAEAEAIQGRNDRRRARDTRLNAPRPVDLLGDIGRRTPLAVLPATAANVDRGEPVRGPAALLAWLAVRGVDLSVTPSGRLLVRGRGGSIGANAREVILSAERLLVGELTGHPVYCEVCEGTAHTATTILFPDLAACDAASKG